MKDICYWVYILHCDNNSFYTGYTNNLSKRYQSHLSGTGHCKYTRSFKPICIIQCWQVVGDKSLAMKIERQIKKLSRAEKEALILTPSMMVTDERIKLVSRMTRKAIMNHL
jgi:putative endonuclease